MSLQRWVCHKKLHAPCGVQQVFYKVRCLVLAVARTNDGPTIEIDRAKHWCAVQFARPVGGKVGNDSDVILCENKKKLKIATQININKLALNNKQCNIGFRMLHFTFLFGSNK